MAKGVSRRKYAKLVSFLTATFSDPKVAHRVRMVAALRLCDVYARVEDQNEKAVARRERALNRETPPPEEVLAPVLDEEDPETTALAFLESMKQGSGRGTHDED